MPFNIDLRTSAPFIKLQVAKNTLTFYFYGADQLVLANALNYWRTIDGYFIHTIPHYNPNWHRGPDAPHLKRNHVHQEELETKHFHHEFTEDITPEILSEYLQKFWQQQQKESNTMDKFFSDDEHLPRVADIYSSFYARHHGSALEADFTRERNLDRNESDAYENSVASQLLFNSFFAVPRVSAPSRVVFVREPIGDSPCSVM